MLPRGLVKEYSKLLALVLRGLDVLAVVVAGLIAFFWRFGNLDLSRHYINALFAASILTLVVFQFFQIYESIRAKSVWAHLRTLIQAIFVVLFLLAGLAFLTKTGETFSRAWFISWAGFSFILLILFRVTLVITLRLMRSQGWNERRVIIIGAGKLGKKLAGTIHQALWTGFRIVAIFDDEMTETPETIAGITVEKMPVNISKFINSQESDIDEVWLALPLQAEERVKEILYQLRHDTIAIRYVLNILGLGLLKPTITDVDGFPMINLNESPMKGFNRLVKAIEDRVLATAILTLVSPLFLLIAIGVKCSSKGPVFFKQLRHGWDGKLIKVYKFRTMVIHTEEQGLLTQAKANDARVTRFGSFLRKTSLDELPQFFNVIQGRMSIVGPRPHAVAHNEFYKESINAYMQRHKVKPGITGWAQINGWRGETDTLDKMEKRIEYDLYYIDNWSLLFDLKIIGMTFFQGFFHKNAY